MTITLAQHNYWELFQDIEEQNTSGADEFDITWKYPEQLGQGYWREIRLRQGVELAIAHYRPHDSITLQLPERPHPIEYSFHLSGGYKNQRNSVCTGQYSLYGSGLAPVEATEWSDVEQVEVNVHIDPNLFTTWLNHSNSIPQELQHLVEPFSAIYYVRSGTTTGAMQTALQQILHCPFQGITKRMYLESKVWELMALLVEQELKLHETKKATHYTRLLKPDDVDRIHQAREILLQRLDNPPSLIELARQVGLNDCTLKRGFRQVFGTTAFGLLHDYRLERASQLLKERRLNISEIAQAIGFANRSYFAAAFRKKFGVTPREYLSSYRNSA
jgi:AraC-like DNA-binding protein